MRRRRLLIATLDGMYYTLPYVKMEELRGDRSTLTLTCDTHMTSFGHQECE